MFVPNDSKKECVIFLVSPCILTHAKIISLSYLESSVKNVNKLH